MKQTLLLSALALALTTGCATQPAAEVTGKAVSQTRAGLADAAMTPLEDLNLRRDQIPPILAGMGNPYEVPHDITCEQITAEVEQLNAVLGPDWDAVKEADNSTVSDQAADVTSDGILKAVASEAGGIIPYRGWVRQLSGAKRHEAKVKQAINKGSARRTYLKAVGAMKECDGIASPNLKAIQRDEKVVFRGDAPDGYTPAPETAISPVEPAPAPDTSLVPAEVEGESLPSVDGHTKADIKSREASAPTSSPPIEY